MGFEVKDCALLLRTSGLPPALNLRELRERIGSAGDNVLAHHFFETSLRPTVDDPFYRNDFAVWASLRLRDAVLAERLGIIDPYACSSMEELRAIVLEILDDRLGEAPTLASCLPGQEFIFLEAVTVVFDTGERIRQPSELAAAIGRMTSGSIYYHFLDARRRPPRRKDDFTAWLLDRGEPIDAYTRRLSSIDFSFRTLPQIREALVQALRQAQEEGTR